VKEFKILDIGIKNTVQFMSFSLPNNLYYGHMQAFSEEIFGNFSKAITFSPQNAADTTAPSLSLHDIRIPVYQEKTIDITAFVYDSSGIENIKDPRIDIDLLVDSDGDGDTKNDNDITSENIILQAQKFFITLPVQLKPENRKIGITLSDANNNIGFSELNLEVYTPTPQITGYGNKEIV
jgi:hypothetical protein